MESGDDLSGPSGSLEPEAGWMSAQGSCAFDAFESSAATAGGSDPFAQSLHTFDNPAGMYNLKQWSCS